MISPPAAAPSGARASVYCLVNQWGIKGSDLESCAAKQDSRSDPDVGPTIRTAGTIDLRGDLRIEQRIDLGREPGPKIHITAPYLNAGSGDPDPDEIAREIAERAALAVVRGDPPSRIADVRNAEIVFKDGVAYNPDELLAAAEGAVGRFDLGVAVRHPMVASLLLVLLVLTAAIVWRRRTAPGLPA